MLVFPLSSSAGFSFNWILLGPEYWNNAYWGAVRGYMLAKYEVLFQCRLQLREMNTEYINKKKNTAYLRMTNIIVKCLNVKC